MNYLGEIEFTKIELINYKGDTINIADLIVEMNIFEDLFSPTLSGNLKIVDALDLPSTFPLTGEEKLEIQAKTPNSKYKFDFKFYVYKLSDRVLERGRAQAYTLHFTSRETIVDINKKISRVFKGSGESIVTDLVSSSFGLNSPKKIFVEPTANNFKFISAYWSPIKTINWVAQRSLNKNGAASYLFFESNQSFEFVSSEALLGSKPAFDYTYSDVDARTGAGKDLNAGLGYVKNLSSDVMFDYMRRTVSGLYTGKLLTFDTNTRVIEGKDYDYLQSFSGTSHLDQYPITTDNLLRSKIASLYFLEKNDEANEFAQGYKNYFVQRNSLIEQLSAYKLGIEVYGNTDIKVGQTINFTINGFRQFSESDKHEIPDDVYSGKYLVTAIRHRIRAGEHVMFMEIIKESFASKLQGKT